MNRWRRLVALLWGAALLAVLLSPLRGFLVRGALESALRPLGVWGPAAFVGLYAVAMVLGLPTLPFTIAAGALFGLVPGTGLAMLGATAGAMGAFALTRWMFRAWAEEHFGAHPALRSFRRGIAEHGLWFVLMVRLVPVTPFNIENSLFALTPLSWSGYLLGTVLGILPGTIAYCWLGLTGAEALEGGGTRTFLGAVLVVLAMSVLSILLRRQAALRRSGDSRHDQ
jgi:uncharacterized membrane protein YdjX (TVP38/TMEM64 family)